MLRRHYFTAGMLLSAPLGFNVSADIGDMQLIHQQERQKAREQGLAPSSPEVRLSTPVSSPYRLIFPLESPCFVIRRVSLTGADAFPQWVHLQRLADQAKGRCMGTKSISLLMGALQNRLAGHGWITSRILAPPQDIRQGELELVVMPGRVEQVRLTQDSTANVTLYSAMPTHAGGLLDLRAIEQGLENLQRLPTVQASVEIVPGQRPGHSDIVIKRTQSRLWRARAWLDDGGTRSTGRYQSGVMLALDNPLSLSDMFYLTAGRDVMFSDYKNDESFSGHYSLPLGYWQLGISANSYDYTQTVARKPRDILYEGDNKSLSVQLGRLIHRNARQKTSLIYEVRANRMRRYINKTQIDNQKRNTSAWSLGVNHRQYVGTITLDAALHYRQGTRWFGALPAPNEPEATALGKVYDGSARLNVPFALLGERFRYLARYRHQLSRTPLTPQDQLSIGGRWTVRGFDGQRWLSGDRGWYLSNDIAWRTPLLNQELYIGADYGEVGGSGSDRLAGRRLAGSVAGLRGDFAAANIAYDLFAGVPLSKPDGFKTDPLSLGFSLQWHFGERNTSTKPK